MVFPGMSFGLQLPTFNKYVVIGAAVAGLSGVAATVYFYRRNQKKRSSEFQNDEDVSQRNCAGRKRKEPDLLSDGIVLNQWDTKTDSAQDGVCFNSSLKMRKASTTTSRKNKPALRKEIRSGNFSSSELLTMSCKKDTTTVKSEATNTPSSVSRLPLTNNKLDKQTVKSAKSESSVKVKRTKKYTRSNSSMNVMRVEERGSNDSAVSTADAYVVKTKKRKSLKMYEKALELVAKGEVKSRKIRTGMKFVRSKEDFLAKVHCLRQGFGVMFRTENMDSWIAEIVGSIAAGILNTTNNIEYFNAANFDKAYFDTFVFLAMEDNQNVITKEIKYQGITHVSFYDIVLCFILMEMLEDIEKQSKTITFPKRSSHLTDRLRVNPIIYAFQDMYRTKQRCGYHVDGFLTRLYRACSCLAPALAIGLRGPTSYLQKASLSFEKETKDYMESLFSFDKVRYTTSTEMAEDLLSLTKEHLTRLNETVILFEKSKQADDAEN